MDVASLAERMTLQKCLSIPPKFMPPAYLEGKSSVYVIELDDAPPRYYVGETDNFRRRIQQHRAKGGEWSNLAAIVLQAPGGKTQARAWESQLIQTLSHRGLQLESISDGLSIRATSLEQSQQ